MKAPDRYRKLDPETGEVMVAICTSCELPILKTEEWPGPLCRCNDGCYCCPRGDEYNGFGSDGLLEFRCPLSCPCHD